LSPFPAVENAVACPVSPLWRLFAGILRFSRERPCVVNRFVVSVYTLRTLCVCLQQRVIRTLQQSLDSGTTARRTFVVVPIHNEVNRLGHPERSSTIHRQDLSRRLPTPL